MSGHDDRDRLFRLLGSIDQLWQRQIQAKPGMPAPGSLEAIDRQHSLGEHPVIPTTIKLAVALDHLIVWSKFYRDLPDHPLPSYSHLTLLRPAFEASPQIRWVLDPAVDSVVRIGRALGVELSNLGWRARVVTSGVLHAQEWASLLGDHTLTREGEPFQIIEHTADPRFALTATAAAVHQFELALASLETYLEPAS